MRLLIIAVLFTALNCTSDLNISEEDVNPQPVNQELIFHSGFEGGTQGIPSGAHFDLIGIDNSVAGPNDWVENLDDHPEIGDFTFQYEGGVESERYIRVIDDPTTSLDNKVLHFWLKEANVERDGVKYKGRAQANIYNNPGIKELYQKVRLYVHEDFNILSQAPATIHWLTIFEFWNNATWGDANFPFRITVEVQKLKADLGEPLNFGIKAQVFEEDDKITIWEEHNSNIDIPIGKWMTVEYYFLEGNEENGRFYLAITPEGEQKSVVFDIHNFTHHPEDLSPNGFNHINPLKLYTSKSLLDFVDSNDKVLQYYWDDIEFWLNKKPD